MKRLMKFNYLQYEGLPMEYVELAAHKLDGLTQHRVWLIVTVCLQKCRHNMHKTEITK